MRFAIVSSASVCLLLASIGCSTSNGASLVAPHVLYQVGREAALKDFVVVNDTIYVTIADANGYGGQPNQLLSVPKSVGDAKVLVKRAENDPGRFDADGSHLYYVGDSTAGGSGPAVQSYALADGSIQTLSGFVQTDGIVYANGSLYWTDQDMAHGYDTGFRRLSLADGTTTFVDPPSGGIVSVFDAVVGSDAIYIGSQGILRATFDDAMAFVLPATTEVTALAVDDTSLYYATETGIGYALFAMPKEGGSSQSLTSASIADASTMQITVTALAVDADDVFFARERYDEGASIPLQSELLRMSKHGGDVVRLAAIDAPATKIVVDATNVFWIDGAGKLQTSSKRGGAPAL